MIYDIAILGAGASGLFLAANLKHRSILLLEHNETIGAKIAISGGGKANITNAKVNASHYKSSDSHFVQKVLDRFSNKDLLTWLTQRGCRPQTLKQDQYFCPKSAKELLHILQKDLHHVDLRLGTEILRVEPGFRIETDRGSFLAKRVVVATGGISYKRLGASGIGYAIAKRFGHSVTDLRPALVGLTVQPKEFWFKELSGVRARARVRVGEKRFGGDILFAHRGITGPAILNASVYWERGAIELSFVDSVRRWLKNPKQIISTQLPLPRRVSKKLLERIGVADKQIGRLGQEEWKRLEVFERYTFAPAGTFGFERAEVTKGGVALDGIDPVTMESRLQKGLYFIGEVLDVTGELGGYNFQWAFSSAWVAKEALTH